MGFKEVKRTQPFQFDILGVLCCPLLSKSRV